MKSVLRKHIEEIVSLTDTEWLKVEPLFMHKKLKKHQFLIQESNAVTNDFRLPGVWDHRSCQSEG